MSEHAGELKFVKESDPRIPKGMHRHYDLAVEKLLNHSEAKLEDLKKTAPDYLRERIDYYVDYINRQRAFITEHVPWVRFAEEHAQVDPSFRNNKDLGDIRERISQAYKNTFPQFS